MENTIYNKVIKSVSDEFKLYEDYLKTLPSSAVLNHAYEYSIKQDILYAIEDINISEEKAAALLKSKNILEDIYKDYNKMESTIKYDVKDILERRFEKTANKFKKPQFISEGFNIKDNSLNKENNADIEI